MVVPACEPRRQGGVKCRASGIEGMRGGPVPVLPPPRRHAAQTSGRTLPITLPAAPAAPTTRWSERVRKKRGPDRRLEATGRPLTVGDQHLAHYLLASAGLSRASLRVQIAQRRGPSIASVLCDLRLNFLLHALLDGGLLGVRHVKRER
jgi:hypothetical protein